MTSTNEQTTINLLTEQLMKQGFKPNAAYNLIMELPDPIREAFGIVADNIIEAAADVTLYGDGTRAAEFAREHADNKHVMNAFAGSHHVELRRLAAEYATSSKVLRYLGADEDMHVQYTVATRERTPASVLDWYSTSEDVDLRVTVAANRGASAGTLVELALDSDERVVAQVAANPAAPAAVLADLSYGVFGVILTVNPSTPGSVLDRLVGLASGTGRFNIVVHPNTMPVTLQSLAVDSCRRVALAAQARLDYEEILAVIDGAPSPKAKKSGKKSGKKRRRNKDR